MIPVKITVTPGREKILMQRMAEIISRVLVSELTDNELLEMIDAFPAWESGVVITATETGFIWKGKEYAVLYLKYDNRLWKVLQAHTTQGDWTPDVAVSLFTEVSPPGTIPAWVQPQGAHDAYNIGNLATHDNPNDDHNIWIYESKIDANTTEPGRDSTYDRWWEPIERVV